MPDIEFGEWLPDRERVAAPGLILCQNLKPTIGGYEFMPIQSSAGLGSIDSPCIGAGRGTLSSGDAFNVAGTAEDLWLDVGAGFVEVSDTGPSAYALSSNQNWKFQQYGQYILASGGAQIPQSYLFGTDVEFGDLDPNASACETSMVFNEFYVLGNVVGQGTNASAVGVHQNGLHWSGIGDPTSWEVVGTQPAIDMQSDTQVFEGDGGAVKAMVPAGEFALIFLERQVWRMDYVGPPLIFAFRKLDNRRGCIGLNSAIAVGSLVYYPSADGFMVCDGQSIQSIGHDKVDTTWAGMLDYDLTARISVVHDNAAPAVYWTIPGGAQGLSQSIIGFQYEIGQWFSLNIQAQWLQTTVPLIPSLDDAPYATMDMDDILELGDVRLDSMSATNLEVLSAWMSDNELYEFNGTTALTGIIGTGDYELEQRSLVRWIRPIFTSDDYSADIASYISGRNLPNANPNLNFTQAKSINSVGVQPIRASGRYIRGIFITSGFMRKLQGFDTKISPVGTR